MNFKSVIIDPPWLERGGGRVKRGADRHYDLMKTDAIIDLLTLNCPPLLHLDYDQSVLFLWVTNNFLLDGLRVMNALGFRYITNLCWAKGRHTLGYYFFGQHELCLFGVRGKWTRRKWVDGLSTTLLSGDIIRAPGKRVHSRKPDILHEVIEQRFPGDYLELFARNPRPNWTTWGNELITTTDDAQLSLLTERS